MNAIFVVRMPWRKGDRPTNRALRGYVAAWLREQRPLAPDVPGREERAAYRLPREDVVHASEMAGETVAGFLRRLIRTYHRSIREIRPIVQPAQAPTRAPAQIARPAPMPPPAPSDPTKTIALTLDKAKELLRWAGCFVAIQPTYRYFRRGDSILADQGNGQLLPVCTLPMPRREAGK